MVPDLVEPISQVGLRKRLSEGIRPHTAAHSVLDGALDMFDFWILARCVGGGPLPQIFPDPDIVRSTNGGRLLGAPAHDFGPLVAFLQEHSSAIVRRGVSLPAILKGRRN